MFLLKLLRVRVFGVGGHPVFDGLSQNHINVSLGDARLHIILPLLRFSRHLLSALNRLEALFMVDFVNRSNSIVLKRRHSDGELLLKVGLLHEVCELEEAESFAPFLGHALQWDVIVVLVLSLAFLL